MFRTYTLSQNDVDFKGSKHQFRLNPEFCPSMKAHPVTEVVCWISRQYKSLFISVIKLIYLIQPMHIIALVCFKFHGTLCSLHEAPYHFNIQYSTVHYPIFKSEVHGSNDTIPCILPRVFCETDLVSLRANAEDCV